MKSKNGVKKNVLSRLLGSALLLLMIMIPGAANGDPAIGHEDYYVVQLKGKIDFLSARQRLMAAGARIVDFRQGQVLIALAPGHQVNGRMIEKKVKWISRIINRNDFNRDWPKLNLDQKKIQRNWLAYFRLPRLAENLNQQPEVRLQANQNFLSSEYTAKVKKVLEQKSVREPLAASISGRVVNQQGAGIANVQVQLWDAYDQNLLVASANTNTNGDYQLTNVVAADYKLFFGFSGYYVNEWYDNQGFSFFDATILTVNDGDAIGNINAELLESGAISGRVKQDGNNMGIINAEARIYDLQYNFISSAVTNANGDYVAYGIPAGQCKVRFEAGNAGNYAPEFYQNSLFFHQAQVVSVSSGATTPGIDASLAIGATISGRVTNQAANGLANIDVYLTDWHFWSVTSCGTDADGNYQLQNLPSGEFFIFFQDYNLGTYAFEWYNNKKTWSAADKITLNPGSQLTGIDAQLEAGGTISGRVRDENGTAIKDINIGLEDIDGNWLDGRNTDANGNYSLTGLAAGSYKVRFDSWDAGNYVRQYYNNKPDFQSADLIEVSEGVITAGIDAVMARAGTITGKVMDDSLQGISGVYVNVNDMNNQYLCGTSTDFNGDYRLDDVPVGQVKVFFGTWGLNNYLGEWYNNKPDFEQATPVNVKPWDTTPNVNAILSLGGSISGRVTDASGNGLAGVSAHANGLNQQWLGGGQTDPDGYYSIACVPVGDCKVQFWKENELNGYITEWYDDQSSFANATIIKVNSGQNTGGINAGLHRSGSISGRVINSAGQGIQNVSVNLYDDSGNNVNGEQTDSNGNFTFSNKLAGSYKILFDPGAASGSYIGEYYNNKLTMASADIIVVAEGQTNNLADAVLMAIADDGFEDNDTLATATTVTPGAYENLYYINPAEDMSERDWFKVYVDAAQAGQDLKIHFKVTSPYPPDPYSGWRSDLDFGIYDETGRMMAFAYGGGDDEILYIPDATAGWYYFDVEYCTGDYGPGGSYSGARYTLNVDLSDNTAIGTITGRLTDSVTGQGVPGALIEVQHSPSDWNTSFPVVTSDLNGNYKVAYAPGNYTLLFNVVSRMEQNPSPNYVSEYYDDKALLSEAQIMTLQAGITIPDVNASLLPGATILGTMLHMDGTPVTEASRGLAYAVNEDYVSVTYCYNDSTGQYKINTLPPGTYRIFFRASDHNNKRYASEFYDNQRTFDAGQVFTVGVGQAVAGVNNQFEQYGGFIRGYVTDENGQGIANVSVETFDPASPGHRMVRAITGSDGFYNIIYIYPGDVKLFFNAAGTLFNSEWYDNQPTIDQAAVLQISAGQVINDINAQLSVRILRDDVVVSWTGQGTWMRNSDTGIWSKLHVLDAKQAVVCDFNGDGVNDLLGWWPGVGIWVMLKPGETWEKLLDDADLKWLTAADMNHDGQDDLVGSWTFGCFWRNSATGQWQNLASAAEVIASGDQDDDGYDDLIGSWKQIFVEGIWIRYGKDGSWKRIMASDDLIQIGLFGDKRSTVTGSWNFGVWVQDPVSGIWKCLHQLGAGSIGSADIDGDGFDDLLGAWSAIPGLWVRYSKDGYWEKLHNDTPVFVSGGRLR